MDAVRIIFPWIGLAAQLASAAYIFISARRAFRSQAAKKENEWEQVFKCLDEFNRYTTARLPVDVIEAQRLAQLELAVFGRVHQDSKQPAEWTN